MRSPSLKSIISQISRYADDFIGKTPFTTQTTAKIIRGMILDIHNGDYHEKIDKVLDQCNFLLAGYGVESTRGHLQVDRYYFDIHLLYVNMGETYAPTIIYDTLKERWYCCSWGDIVESDCKRFR